MKKPPVDIFSIKEYGIEKWHKKFFWPVSIEEYKSLLNEIEKLFRNIQDTSEPEVKDAFWVLYSHFSIEAANLLHDCLLIQRLREIKPDIIPSDFFSEMSEEDNKTGPLTSKPLPDIPSIRYRIYNYLGSYYKNYKTNGIETFLYFSKKHYLVADGANEEKLEYAGAHGKRIYHIPYSSLKPYNIKVSKISISAKESVSGFIEGLKRIIKEYDIKINENQLNNTNKTLTVEVQYIMNYVRSMRKKMRTLKQKTILVHILGNLYMRCLCIAGRKEGHHVVGFSHGNYTGIFNTCATTSIFMGVVDTFVTANKSSVKLFSMAAEEYLKPCGIDVKIEFLKENKYYKGLYKSFRDDKIPTTIKNVMIIEDPLTPGFQPWPYYLDFNIRKAKVIAKLKDIKLILKKHPDRLKESEGVYDNYYDEMITTPFEKVYDKADAYIFPHIGTTTFGFAVFTKKPIIIFEHMFKYIWEPVHESLRKRCRVIPSWYDENSRIMFDEDALLDALQRKPEPPDDEFIQKYMLP